VTPVEPLLPPVVLPPPEVPPLDGFTVVVVVRVPLDDDPVDLETVDPPPPPRLIAE